MSDRTLSSARCEITGYFLSAARIWCPQGSHSGYGGVPGKAALELTGGAGQLLLGPIEALDLALLAVDRGISAGKSRQEAAKVAVIHAIGAHDRSIQRRLTGPGR